MAKYLPTIGLEVHAELKTRTKMFCDSRNDPDEKRPNVNICPICMAHPGTLPVINKAAVRHVLRVGTALGATLADFTEFDRKSYFYPDLPKGYQISQYKYPLVSGGSLNGVAITRVHLEEDAARNQHLSATESVVDFNRAGVPLMELVTEPVITSAKQASDFARELQLLLRYLGASDANMDKGEMRVEANISVAKAPDMLASADTRGTDAEGREKMQTLGTKVEVKNLNSFKVVEKAIEYELARQVKELEAGGTIRQETRGWDDAKQATYSQREKQSSHDYRYFPDPDLPKLKLSGCPEFANLRETLPELPWERRERLKTVFGLKDEAAEIFVGDHFLGSFFEETVKGKEGEKGFVALAANYITSDLMALMKAEDPRADLGEDEATDRLIAITPAEFAKLICMLADGEISSRAGKDILLALFATGGSPRAYAETNGLMQKSDEGTLSVVVHDVITANESVAADVRGGKLAALQFLVGQAMRETKGSANPAVLRKMFAEKLGITSDI